eukprot:scaffold2286_cov240-Pinguiococcus_pyrenoidosus.AAC.10
MEFDSICQRFVCPASYCLCFTRTFPSADADRSGGFSLDGPLPLPLRSSITSSADLTSAGWTRNSPVSSLTATILASCIIGQFTNTVFRSSFDASVAAGGSAGGEQRRKTSVSYRESVPKMFSRMAFSFAPSIGSTPMLGKPGYGSFTPGCSWGVKV